MEHRKELLSITLSSLVPSPFNVRRHKASDVEELAALIDAQGLLHNLVVTEQAVGRGSAAKRGFAVAAGERRRRALVLLQQRGRLPRNHEVLCELVPRERALEISLAENSGREPMHPADEFEAFKALIDEGRGVEDVAARFGVSVLTVQRRLKLSALSPRLLALYREGGINLDQLMALAVSDDHAAQERAWFDAAPWDRTPTALRRRLTAGEVEAAGNALVRFVGIDAYEAAGGDVRRDLFDDHQCRYLSDPELLRRLAADKLETLTASVRDEGWSWVEAHVEVDSQALRQFTPSEHTLRKPSPPEQAALAQLDRRSAELQQQADAMDDAPEWSDDEAECIDLEQQDIEARRRLIHAGLKVWSPAAMAHAGVIVTVNREGDAEILCGLVRESDRKAQATRRRAARGAGDAAADNPDETRVNQEPRTADCSESLARRLSAHRTVALQVLLSRNPSVALAALTHVLVQRVFADDYPRIGSALQVSATLPAHALLAAADDLKGSKAWLAVESAKVAWRERLPGRAQDWLRWLMDLPQAEILELLALCVASTVNALPGAGPAHDTGTIADAVALDMADWWEPTAQSYLQHVPKVQIIAAMKEAGLTPGDKEVAAMKKGELVAKAEAALAGKRWLPVSLRRPVS